MNNEAEKYDLIEKYLTGKLQGEELKRFEESVRSDPDFAKELELHRLAGDFLADAAEDTFKKKLHKAEKEYLAGKSAEKTKVVPLRTVLRIAAAVALIFVGAYAVYFLVNNQSPESPETLFAENFKPAEYYGARSADSMNETILEEAYEDYKIGNYRDALAGLEKASFQNPDNPEILFFKGNCRLALENTESAINTFQQLIDSGNPLFVYDARWYLALAYLQKGDAKAAEAQLKKLKNSDSGPYRKKAEDLINKLK